MEGGPPVFPRDSSCPAVLWIPLTVSGFRIRNYHPLRCAFPYTSASLQQYRYEVRTPKILLSSVWPVPRSLATTCGIAFAFSSSPYLDVSVQEVPLPYLCIQYGMPKLYFGGLLHSDICGSLPAYGSPQHFVVCHVLLRLPVPRHSPCALLSLTFKLCVLSLDLIVVFFTHFFF